MWVDRRNRGGGAFIDSLDLGGTGGLFTCAVWGTERPVLFITWGAQQVDKHDDKQVAQQVAQHVAQHVAKQSA